MKTFYGIQQQYEQEEALQPEAIRLWPATYRQSLPDIELDKFSLNISIEEKASETLNWEQVKRLTKSTQYRELFSKAGWCYQGMWSCLSFQTLISRMPPTTGYYWVRLHSANGTDTVIPAEELPKYTIVMQCDDKPLSTLYGGPLMAVCFDYYAEYSIPHLQGISFIRGTHQYQHPNMAIGFDPKEKKVETGRYFVVHKGRAKHLRFF